MAKNNKPSKPKAKKTPATSIEGIVRMRGGFDPGFILRIQLQEMLSAQAYVFVDLYGDEAWRTNEDWEIHRPGEDPAKNSWNLVVTRVGRKDVPNGNPAQALGRYPQGDDFDARAKKFFNMEEYLAGPGGGWYKFKRSVVWHSVVG